MLHSTDRAPLNIVPPPKYCLMTSLLPIWYGRLPYFFELLLKPPLKEGLPMLCLGSSNITLKSHDLESWLITFITLWLSMLHIFLPNLTLLLFTENEKNQQKGIWRKHGKPFLPFLLLINRLPVFNCTSTPPFYHISISPNTFIVNVNATVKLNVFLLHWKCS